jgi:hypothetical protein
MKNALSITAGQHKAIESMLSYFGVTPEADYWLMIDEGCRYLRAAIGSDVTTYLRFRQSKMFWRFYTTRWAQVNLQLAANMYMFQRCPEVHHAAHRYALKPTIPAALQKEILTVIRDENTVNTS